MKKCKRLIYAMLAVVLLTATLPTMAHEGLDGAEYAGLFARIEAFVAKLWPFAVTKPTDTKISGSPTAPQSIDAIGKIGINISVGGVALPSPEDATESPAPESAPGAQGG